MNATNRTQEIEGMWRPQGILLTQLREHTRPVTRLGVAHDNSYFVSASDDGTLKVRIMSVVFMLALTTFDYLLILFVSSCFVCCFVFLFFFGSFGIPTLAARETLAEPQCWNIHFQHQRLLGYLVSR
jgi:hypothetical protein